MLCEHGNISPCLECDIGPLKAENEKLSKDVAELVEVLECSIETTENVDGGPAFPFGQTDSMNGQLVNGWGSEGMTLRDYFAAKAMQGAMANPEVKETARARSEWAYEIADAMLKAREVGHDSQ